MSPTFITIITLSIIFTIATFALDWIRRGWAEIVDEAWREPFGDMPRNPFNRGE